MLHSWWTDYEMMNSPDYTEWQKKPRQPERGLERIQSRVSLETGNMTVYLPLMYTPANN